MLHGRLGDAWRYNPLGIAAVAAVVLVTARTFGGLAAHRWVDLHLRWTPRGRLIVITVVIVAVALLEWRQQAGQTCSSTTRPREYDMPTRRRARRLLPPVQVRCALGVDRISERRQVETSTRSSGLLPAVARIRSWTLRRWTVAIIATGVAALLIGVPTGIIPTDFYSRMTPVLWWNYPVWAISSLLTGLVASTYVKSKDLIDDPTEGSVNGRLGFGGLMSAFAVGCPICNKLVVGLVGVSGALNVWAPVQPFLGIASVLLLTVAFRTRLKYEQACRRPSP